jgi:CARDB
MAILKDKLKTMQDNNNINKVKEHSIKTLAVFGLIGLLIIVSIAIIRVAPIAIRGIASAAVSLSSIFVPADKLSLQSSTYNANTGEPFTLTWSRTNQSTNGSYTVSYPCTDGVHLEAVLPGKNDVIFCNTLYHFLNSNNSLTLAGFIAPGTAQNGAALNDLDIPVTLHYTQNGASSETTEATVTVNVSTGANSQTANQTTSTNTANTTTPSNTASNVKINVNIPSATPSAGQPITTTYNMTNGPTYTDRGNAGEPDLVATILQTGVVSTTTGAFTPQSSVKTSDRAAVHFQIQNIGTKASGSWTFAVVLPTYPAYTFQSGTQPSLAPGDRIEFTLGFDNIVHQSQGTIVVNADPLGQVQEANKVNNIATSTIYINTAN